MATAAEAPGGAGVQFAWTDQMVGQRACYYPQEEGNRVAPHSERSWSAVETAPRERLHEIQLAKLQTLTRHVQATSPFYAERWKAAGVSAEDIRTLDDLANFPIISKEDFEQDQRASPPFGTALTVPAHHQMKLWQTSGTAGAPRLWAETKEDWENGMFMYARCLYAHGIRPGWRAWFAFGYPPFIAFWLAHSAAEMMGCQPVPKGPLPTQAWLSMMRRLSGTAPGFMCATPTYAQRQLEVAAEMGIDPRQLGINILSLAGEPGACVPSTKSGLENAWGAKVHDILGSTETSGPILFTCEAQADLEQPSDHANVDYFILELLDRETRKPVAEGELGSMCVTALGRTGIPAVRFLLNDFVRLAWDEPCACGRTLPLVKGGVSARTDDMVIIKGVNVYPSLIENLIRAVPGLSTEYLLVRQEGTAMVRLEALADAEGQYEGLSSRVQADIREATSLTLSVEVLPPGSLPRSETKSKRIQ